jgi:hypothetical protein
MTVQRHRADTREIAEQTLPTITRTFKYELRSQLETTVQAIRAKIEDLKAMKAEANSQAR